MGPKHEESLVGKTFEKCRIIAKLGMGGMGSVWLAEHFGLGRKVAVKILPPEMGRDPEPLQAFRRSGYTAKVTAERQARRKQAAAGAATAAASAVATGFPV